MNEDKIRKYAELMNELGLTGLEISDGNKKIRLEKSVAIAQSPAPAIAEPPKKTKAVNDDAHQVISPMVGIIHMAEAENKKAFVEAGDTVKKGDVLCVLEAMKLMNEITADRNGTVLEVCVKDGQVVENGTVLFLIGE